MKSMPVITATLLGALAVTGCQMTPYTPIQEVITIPATSGVTSAVQRARHQDLRLEIEAQHADLVANLGLDRAYLLDAGNSILVTVPGDGAFEGQTDRLTPSGIEVIRRLAQSMNRFPNTRISIAGNTTGGRSPYADQILSERRAVAAKAVLMSHGIDACRIGVFGRGSEDPVGRSQIPRENQFNSRLEVTVVPTQDGACT